MQERCKMNGPPMGAFPEFCCDFLALRGDGGFEPLLRASAARNSRRFVVSSTHAKTPRHVQSRRSEAKPDGTRAPATSSPSRAAQSANRAIPDGSRSQEAE